MRALDSVLDIIADSVAALSREENHPLPLSPDGAGAGASLSPGSKVLQWGIKR